MIPLGHPYWDTPETRDTMYEPFAAEYEARQQAFINRQFVSPGTNDVAEPARGIGPPTCRLQSGCSTIELGWRILTSSRPNLSTLRRTK